MQEMQGEVTYSKSRSSKVMSPHQDQNLALTVLHVPYSLDSRQHKSKTLNRSLVQQILVDIADAYHDQNSECVSTKTLCVRGYVFEVEVVQSHVPPLRNQASRLHAPLPLLGIGPGVSGACF